MAQMQMRAVGSSCAVGCVCLSVSWPRAPRCTLKGAPPAQLRAAPIASLHAPKPARTPPNRLRVVVVQAKRGRWPGWLSTPELSWWHGSCRLCDVDFPPVVRRQSKGKSGSQRRLPQYVEGTGASHYGGRQHHNNEQRAKLIMRIYQLEDVEDLFDDSFECVCGFAASGHHGWRKMAIHLEESKTCLDEVKTVLAARKRSSEASSISTDDSEDKAEHSTTQAHDVAMPKDMDLPALRVAELKDLCRARSLPVSGTKAVLIARLKGEAPPLPTKKKAAATKPTLFDSDPSDNDSDELRRAKLIMRTFRMEYVDDLFNASFECVCGRWALWRDMAIHLEESKECVDEAETVIAAMEQSCGPVVIRSGSSKDEYEDEAEHGIKGHILVSLRQDEDDVDFDMTARWIRWVKSRGIV